MILVNLNVLTRTIFSLAVRFNVVGKLRPRPEILARY